MARIASSVPTGNPSVLRKSGSFSFSASSFVKCSRRAWSLGKFCPRHSTWPAASSRCACSRSFIVAGHFSKSVELGSESGIRVVARRIPTIFSGHLIHEALPLRPGLADDRLCQVEHLLKNPRSTGRLMDLTVLFYGLKHRIHFIGVHQWCKWNHQCTTTLLRSPPTTGFAVNANSESNEFTPWRLRDDADLNFLVE